MQKNTYYCTFIYILNSKLSSALALDSSCEGNDIPLSEAVGGYQAKMRSVSNFPCCQYLQFPQHLTLLVFAEWHEGHPACKKLCQLSTITSRERKSRVTQVYQSSACEFSW